MRQQAKVLRLCISLKVFNLIEKGEISEIHLPELTTWRRNLTQCYQPDNYCATWPYPACKNCKISPVGHGPVFKTFDTVILTHKNCHQNMCFQLFSIEIRQRKSEYETPIEKDIFIVKLGKSTTHELKTRGLEKALVD